jgi:VCBS repeat-containing protein
MKQYLLLIGFFLFVAFTANAQLDSTKVVDNKGTIKYVLKAKNSKIITQQDSTILFVTPKQLSNLQSQGASTYVKYADTSAMLAAYLNSEGNGLTKSGQSISLGGTLTTNATIVTSEESLLRIQGLQSGSTVTDSVMVVDGDTGALKWISASKLFNALTFENGLTKSGNTVKLGGALNEATTITTDATNVLKIEGLQAGNLGADSLVVTSADGTLKKVNRETVVQSGEVNITATLNQSSITVANMPASASKVWVFRNGAKLVAGEDYTTAAGEVTLTPTIDWSVLAGDNFEVQWVK